MTRQAKERRRHRRAKAAIGFMVGSQASGTALQLRDISLSGISFRADKPIEFMTQLSMTLIFPTEHRHRNEMATSHGIQCEGAVVRCNLTTAENKSSYDIAVFFTQLSKKAKEAIENYVQKHQ